MGLDKRGVAMVAVMFLGCGAEDADSNDKGSTIEGTWELTVSGESEPVAKFTIGPELLELDDGFARHVFKRDGDKLGMSFDHEDSNAPKPQHIAIEHRGSKVDLGKFALDLGGQWSFKAEGLRVDNPEYDPTGDVREVDIGEYCLTDEPQCDVWYPSTCEVSFAASEVSATCDGADWVPLAYWADGTLKATRTTPTTSRFGELGGVWRFEESGEETDCVAELAGDMLHAECGGSTLDIEFADDMASGSIDGEEEFAAVRVRK